jgi:DNA-directed RNA polymerase specialized sigma24 family protein
MPDDASTTYWLKQLKAGNPQAPLEVCDRCWRLVVHQARLRLHNQPIVSDPEDIAVSVFDTFFRGTAEGKYDATADGNDLRKLFLAITRNKTLEHLRREHRQKRGGDVAKTPAADDLAAPQPDPALEAEWNDQCQWLLQNLDEGLRDVALLRLEGLANKELARKLAMPLRSVERKLALIREIWSNLGENRGRPTQTKTVQKEIHMKTDTVARASGLN